MTILWRPRKGGKGQAKPVQTALETEDPTSELSKGAEPGPLTRDQVMDALARFAHQKIR